MFSEFRIFGEPAWDILLDLYLAHQSGKPVAVTSACVAAAVPVTTALRWLGTLEQHELVQRTPDSRDRRRMLVALTTRALDLMDSYFSQVASATDPSG